jgi:glycosyltransferase involved in cell wall biosynthesis
MTRRALLLVNSLGVGGSERNVAMLSAHMDLSRYVPEIWTLVPGGFFEDEVLQRGIRIRHLGREWAYSPTFALQTVWKLTRTECDVVHAFLPAIGFYAAVAAGNCLLRAPLVYSEGTLAFTLGRAKRQAYQFMLGRCAALSANSNVARDFLASLGVSKKIRVIPNGHRLPGNSRRVDRRTLRARVGASDQDYVLAYVGRLISTKRVKDLVQAFAIAHRTAPDLRLFVAGDGPERANLERLTAEAGLKSNVTFLGFLRDVPSLLECADAFVFPSELEGLPNAVIEAALHECPIIACDVGGVRDVVRDGDEAVLVSPRSPGQLARAILAVRGDRALAGRMAAAAKLRAVANYSIERVATAICDLYDDILDRREQGGGL